MTALCCAPRATAGRSATASAGSLFCRMVGRYRHRGDWLFVHYEQLLDGTAVWRLGEALGARLDPGLADEALHRSRPLGEPRGEASILYDELCVAAGFAR